MINQIQNLKIGDQKVGIGSPVFIIAEAGVNHNGKLVLAKKLVDIAVSTGVNAIKFQTFQAESLVTADASQADYQKKNIRIKETQFQMLKRLELSRDDHILIRNYCNKKGIIFLSTPFSESDADFLDYLGVPAFKIPSGEINNLPYLAHIAKKGKPMIVSTGMSDLGEIQAAINTIKTEKNNQVAILHSTSNYPPSVSGLNLRAISTVFNYFAGKFPVGYSDNGTEGFLADTIAVSLGACIIEKHFTIDKKMSGPDHKASLNPTELREMVSKIRLTEKMLGSGNKFCTPEERSIKLVARKSIVARNFIAAGSRIKLSDLVMKRPGTGIPPSEIKKVLNKKVKVDIFADKVLSLDWLQ